MSKPKVALPFLAGAALLGVLWFSFRDHDLGQTLKPAAPAASRTSTSSPH